MTPTEWIPARLFGGGLPAIGESAQVKVVDNELQVHSASTARTVAIAAVRVREIGTGRAGVEVAWDEPGGVLVVHVFDQAGVRALLDHPAFNASPQMQAFRADRKRMAIGRTAGWVAIVLFLALPLFVVLLFLWQADRVAMVAAERIPIEQEMALGEQAFESMRGSLELQDEGAAHHAVQALGKRLTEGSRYSYRFYVARSDAINAFALPGGIIVVNTGLIDATRRAEELAGVLAHEVQHVELRHSLRAVVKELGLRGLWLLVTGDVGGRLIGQAALELTVLKFSRDAEMEADTRGFDVLVEENIDPSGMVDFFAVLADHGGATPPAFLATHPPSDERQRAVRERRDRLDRDFPPLAGAEWPPQ